MKKYFNLRTLIILALLAAIGAVLGSLVAIKLPFGGVKMVQVSLAPIPVMLAGIFFGPLAGALVGFVTDTSAFFIGGAQGAYNPIFSVTMALVGVIAGLFYLRNKKNNVWKAIGTSITSQVVCSVALNTLAIWFFYHVPLKVLLPTRLISAAVEAPIYVVLLMLLVQALSPIALKVKKKETT